MMRSFRFTPLTLNIIRRHAGNRRDASTIAGMLNCSPGTIESICNKHGIELVAIPDGAAPLSPYRSADGSRPQFRTIEVPIGLEAFGLIQREAARRGVKASTLIARVAEIVAADKLFSAVLDK
jgi:hypothetical protein